MAESAVKSDDNMMAALAYLLSFITGIIIYVMYKEKGSKFVLFHAVQAIIYGVAVFCLWIVLMFVGIVLAFIPVVGWLLGMLIWGVMLLAVLGSWVFLMYKAYSGVKFKLPVIGNMAEKYA